MSTRQEQDKASVCYEFWNDDDADDDVDVYVVERRAAGNPEDELWWPTMIRLPIQIRRVHHSHPLPTRRAWKVQCKRDSHLVEMTWFILLLCIVVGNNGCNRH